MMNSEQTRRVIAKSNIYNVLLKAIRLAIWDLDEKPEMSRQDQFNYEALEAKDKALLERWKLFRTKNGLSNEAIS